MTTDSELAALLTEFVDRLTESGAIESPAVERAFRRVPRHRFVRQFFLFDRNGTHRSGCGGDEAAIDDLEVIYSDVALATQLERGIPVSSSTRPSLMAKMLELLIVDRGMSVLEIGAGTGYNAGLLAELVGGDGRVATLDIRESVLESARRSLRTSGYGDVTVLHGDGFFGAPDLAPFDRIEVTGGASDISPAWFTQLTSEGSVLVPLEHGGDHPLVQIAQTRGRTVGRVVGWSGFMRMEGQLGYEQRRPRGMREPQSTERVRRRPVWADFQTSRRSTATWSTDEMAFLFFLSLRSSLAFSSLDGFGLSDEENWVLVGETDVQALGDRRLPKLLDEYYFEWQECGAPRVADYRLEFVDRTKSRPPDSGWYLDRAHHREYVTLA